jgi:hypothetical protein
MSQLNMKTIADFVGLNQTTLNIVSCNGVDLSFVTHVHININGAIHYQLEGQAQINFSCNQGVYTLSHNRTTCEHLDELISQLNQAVSVDGSTIHGIGTSNYFVSLDNRWVKHSIWDLPPRN